jgi:hypothetical protein
MTFEVDSHHQNKPENRGIRLIGDRFHFHVAHLFKRDKRMLQIEPSPERIFSNSVGYRMNSYGTL